MLVLNSKRINKNRPEVNTVKNYVKYAKVVHLINFQRAHVKSDIRVIQVRVIGLLQTAVINSFPFSSSHTAVSCQEMSRYHK